MKKLYSLPGSGFRFAGFKWSYLLFFCMGLSDTSFGQFSDPEFYFESCANSSEESAKACKEAEMKNFISQKIMKYVKPDMLAGKEKTRLTLKIDTTGMVLYTVLSWLKDGKYGIKELNRNEIVVKGLKTKSILIVTYDVTGNTSNSISALQIKENTVFRSVENMPVIDSCGSTSKMAYKDCVKKYFSDYVKQNITYHPKDIEFNTKGKVVLAFVIEPDGSVADFQFYKPGPTPESEQSVREALKSILSKEKRFTPGFQLNNPSSVFFAFEIPFEAVKK